LLYLPLYFHEFGHLLYACHKQELDALVRDLQQEVDGFLRPSSVRNDKHAAWQSSHREAIVTAWYNWAQEFFCDAVGLIIGGPAFLWAFSTYLSTLDRGDFYRSPLELRGSTHPVTFLRVRLLTDLGSTLGLSRPAQTVMQEWVRIAAAMDVSEDYHGFYDDELADPIHRTIDDMVTEVSPRAYTDAEIGGNPDLVSPDDTPVSLVHKAWHAWFVSTEDAYPRWEGNAIAHWLEEERCS
jgi:hypothetical protein